MARIDPCREYVRDIRMIEQGERLTFELEAAQGVWVILRTTQYLERDFTLRLLLFGEVDGAHATAPEQAADAEFPELLWQCRIGGGCLGRGLGEQGIDAAGAGGRA
ncbi:MAG: hypothetical protein IPF83_00185 [Rhodanobacteraceae bacterium]|nr:hypothetical protein [Rhodanobacteraceae bacterium]